jgi:hypothetical protein
MRPTLTATPPSHHCPEGVFARVTPAERRRSRWCMRADARRTRRTRTRPHGCRCRRFAAAGVARLAAPRIGHRRKAFAVQLKLRTVGRVAVIARDPAARTFAARSVGSRRYSARIVLPLAGRWTFAARLRGRSYRLGPVVARTPTPVLDPVILRTPAGIVARPEARCSSPKAAVTASRGPTPRREARLLRHQWLDLPRGCRNRPRGRVRWHRCPGQRGRRWPRPCGAGRQAARPPHLGGRRSSSDCRH